MGYSSYIDCLPGIKPKEWKNFKKARNKLLKILPKESQIRDYLDNMELDNKEQLIDNIYGNDAKFYDLEPIICFLAPFAAAGEEFLLTGEDGQKWGFGFDGKGGAYEMEWPPPIKGAKMDTRPETWLKHPI